MDCFSFACLGCGVGIGAAISSFRQTRGPPHKGALHHRSQSEKCHAPNSNEPLINESADQECQWLNTLVTILWPRIDQFLKILVDTTIHPAINEALPSVMKGAVKINRCSLGEATPSFSNFKVKERTNNAITLEISVEVTSNLDVQIKAMKLPLGIREFFFRGVFTVVLEPPAQKPPFFGGIEVYLVNPPELDFDFTGAANIADLKVVKTVLQKTIRSQMKKLLVVPARIAVDLLPDDDADEAELKCPEPIGALRILVKSAKDLRGDDFNITGERTSDPYVTIEVGQETWKTSVVKATCNPVWEHGNVHDFLVYDAGQHITFEVWDWDRVGADDLLGTVQPTVPVEHFSFSGQVMDEGLHVVDDNGPAGSLVVSTRWFKFTDKVPVAGIPAAVARGPHQLFLTVKIQDAHELPADSAAPFKVHISVGKDYTATTDVSKPPPAKKTSQDVMKVCTRLHRMGMPVQDIAHVTGMQMAEVSMVIKQQSPASSKATAQALRQKEAAMRPTFNENVRILLPWTEDIMNESVSLELHDSHGRRVGSKVEVKLAEAVGKELHGPFGIMPGAAIVGVLSTKWFCLP